VLCPTVFIMAALPEVSSAKVCMQDLSPLNYMCNPPQGPYFIMINDIYTNRFLSDILQITVPSPYQNFDFRRTMFCTSVVFGRLITQAGFSLRRPGFNFREVNVEFMRTK
jgi:hypothetical protein